MRAHLTVLSMVVALTVATGADARGPQAKDPHLRPASPASRDLVASAIERSATVSNLADQLKATDVVAYVVPGPCKGGERDSAIQFVGKSGVERFMAIRVNSALPVDRQIALIGHELQHAVDMAKASWVTDQARMGQYFAWVGWRNGYPEPGFETLSAMQTERKITKEIVVAERALGTTHQPPR